MFPKASTRPIGLLIVTELGRVHDRVAKGGIAAGDAAGGDPVEECAICAIADTLCAGEGTGAVFSGTLRPTVVRRLRRDETLLGRARDRVTAKGRVGAGDAAGG